MDRRNMSENDRRRVCKLEELVLAMSDDVPDAIALCVGVIAEFARNSSDPREVMRIVAEQLAALGTGAAVDTSYGGFVS